MKRSKQSFSGKDSKSGETRRHNLGGHVPISSEQRDTGQVTPVPVCLQRVLSLTTGHLSNFYKSFLKVHMMNGNDCIVGIMDETKVQDVIGHVIDQLSDGQKSEPNLYSLLAVCETSNIRHWLHKDMTISESHKELRSMQAAPDEWRFELKIRFFFNTVVDLLQTDRVAFFYLFDQVKNHMREQKMYENLEKDVAIELVSLEIRIILRDKIPKTPSRRVNNVVSEDLDWKKHIPHDFLPGSDAKNLSKTIQKTLKGFLPVLEEECILKYLNLVSHSWRYFEESYECQVDDLTLTSSPTVKVIVGPTVGIIYETVSEPLLITLTKFDKIKTMETQDVGFGLLMITFHDGRPPIILRCLSKYQNKQLAYLIDGYCILLRTSGENSAESAYESGQMCHRFVMSETKIGSQKEAPDYAILEENVENEIPLSVIKNTLSGPPCCTCPKVNEMNSPPIPFSSTPDLLSTAHQSSDGRPWIISQDASCGSTSDEINIDLSSVSLSNTSMDSQSNETSILIKLTSEVIEERLRIQKQQSEDDAKWLHREEAKRIIGENNMKSPNKKIIDHCDDDLNLSSDSISKFHPESSDAPIDLLHKVKLDRSSDALYCATTALVQSIVDLKCAVQQGETEGLVDSAKAVGIQLKAMLNDVQSEISSLSLPTQREVETAQKTLSSDLGHLIDAMKMVLHYSPTDLAQEYRHKMLQLGHTLAVDAKTLFDIIDKARKKILTHDLTSSKHLNAFAPIPEAPCE